MKLNKSLISISLAVLLVGCGSSEGSENSLVCLDTNMNGECESSEKSERVEAWDGENEIETTLSGSSPLAYNGKNGYIFTAPVGSAKIYPGTTMLNNELVYNQIIATKTKQAVKAYVISKFGAEPTAENKKDIAEAIKINIAQYPNKSRYAVIAAVINKVMADPAGDIKGISVTLEDISSADVPSLAKLELKESLSKNVDANIEQQDADGWIDTGDASIAYISAKNGKVVGSSHYHNALTVIDVATQNSVFSPVSVITDHGHHTDSESGASENYLRDVVLSSDANYIYANIPPKKATSITADTETIGLYKIKIEDDGSIATVETALVGNGRRISIDETVSKRVDKRVSQFALSSDDSKVAVLDSDNNLFVYDGDLTNQLAAIETDGFSAIAIEGDTLFAVLDKSIIKLSASDLTQMGQIELSFEPTEMMVNSEGNKLLAVDHGSGITHVAIVNLSDSSVNSSTVSMTTGAADVSSDFTKLALVDSSEQRVLIVNLSVPGFSIQSSHNIENGSKDVAFLDTDSLAIISGNNALSVLDITTTTENISLSSKIALAMDGLNESTINSGGYFNAVTNDLTLNSNYENIDIAWSESGLSTNLLLPDGTVTRPAIDTENRFGNLSALLSATFRGDEVTDNKAFDITIRKLVPTSDVTSTLDLNKDFRGGYMSVGANGKVASLNKDGDDGGLYILDSDGANFNFYVGDMNSSDGETYHKFGEAEEGIAVGYTKENQVVAVTTIGNIYRYTVNGMNDITESQKITLSDENTHSAVFNSSKTKLAILVSDESDNFTTKIYDIADDGTVEFSQDIAMEKLEYNSELAINDDASIVYTRSEENIVNAQNGTIHTSFTVGERVRGLFYVNDTLHVTNSTGKLFSFANGNLSSDTKHDSGHNGRIYMIKEVGEELFVFLYASGAEDSGVSIVDKTTLEEIHFISSIKAYRGAVSADGKSIYTFNYTSPRKLSYINLP